MMPQNLSQSCFYLALYSSQCLALISCNMLLSVIYPACLPVISLLWQPLSPLNLLSPCKFSLSKSSAGSSHLSLSPDAKLVIATPRPGQGSCFHPHSIFSVSRASCDLCLCPEPTQVLFNSNIFKHLED